MSLQALLETPGFIESLRSGDQDSWTRFHIVGRPEMLKAAKRKVSSHVDAENMVQEWFLWLHMNLHQISDEDLKKPGYVNQGVRWQRSKVLPRRRQPRTDTLNGKLRSALLDLMPTLDEHERRIAKLHWGADEAEIAIDLKTDVDQVRKEVAQIVEMVDRKQQESGGVNASRRPKQNPKVNADPRKLTRSRRNILQQLLPELRSQDRHLARAYWGVDAAEIAEELSIRVDVVLDVIRRVHSNLKSHCDRREMSLDASRKGDNDGDAGRGNLTECLIDGSHMSRTADDHAVEREQRVFAKRFSGHLERLPESERNVLQCRYCEGLTVHKTATELEITDDVVKYRQSTGLAKLLDCEAIERLSQRDVISVDQRNVYERKRIQGISSPDVARELKLERLAVSALYRQAKELVEAECVRIMEENGTDELP